MVVGLLWVVALLNYMTGKCFHHEALCRWILPSCSHCQFGNLMLFLWIYGLMSPVSGIIADRMNGNG